jgi:hypothetical protein
LNYLREESCGCSSDDDSVLWTEEVDEELESISLMDDDMEVLPLEPKLAPSRAPPPFKSKFLKAWAPKHFRAAARPLSVTELP